MSSIVEWESTVHIASNEIEFFYIQRLIDSKINNDDNNKNRNNNNNDDDDSTNFIFNDFGQFKLKTIEYETDTVFIFNGGIRLARRNYEQKTTIATRKLLGCCEGETYPITRAISIENPLSIKTLNLNAIEKTILRYIQYYTFDLKLTTTTTTLTTDVESTAETTTTTTTTTTTVVPAKVRVTYNKTNGVYGSKYSIEYEVEYPPDTPYDIILKYEDVLMRAVYEDRRRCERCELKLNGVFSSVMSKVQMWHCFDPKQEYLWAYKWNGIKGKMMLTSNTNDDGELLAYLWPDAGAIQIKPYRNIDLGALEKMCVLVEIMDDYVVIIGIISSMYEDGIYTTEPKANIDMLDHLRNNVITSDSTIDNKPIIVQRFYGGNLPNAYDETKFDGFIIVQNDLIIKWKIPTIDVKCVDKYVYSVAGQTFRLAHCGESGKIYEMSYNFKILRQRNDRIISSSVQEYEVFVKSVQMIQQQEMASLEDDTKMATTFTAATT